MTTQELLDKRHDVMLQWSDPWPAISHEGKIIYVPVIHRATVHDCIALQRRAAIFTQDPEPSDAMLLDEFMAVNWARPDTQHKDCFYKVRVQGMDGMWDDLGEAETEEDAKRVLKEVLDWCASRKKGFIGFCIVRITTVREVLPLHPHIAGINLSKAKPV